jgi:hypothetical protein
MSLRTPHFADKQARRQDAIVNTLGHLAWINLPSLREGECAQKSDDHCAHMIA